MHRCQMRLYIYLSENMKNVKKMLHNDTYFKVCFMILYIAEHILMLLYMYVAMFFLIANKAIVSKRSRVLASHSVAELLAHRYCHHLNARCMVGSTHSVSHRM